MLQLLSHTTHTNMHACKNHFAHAADSRIRHLAATACRLLLLPNIPKKPIPLLKMQQMLANGYQLGVQRYCHCLHTSIKLFKQCTIYTACMQQVLSAGKGSNAKTNGAAKTNGSTPSNQPGQAIAPKVPGEATPKAKPKSQPPKGFNNINRWLVLCHTSHASGYKARTVLMLNAFAFIMQFGCA